MLVGGTLAIVPQYQVNKTDAAAIISRESSTRETMVALKDENQRLIREVRDARLTATDRAPPSRVSVARPSTTVGSSPAAVSKSVVVTPQGTLKWEDKPVTLGQFLINLASLEASVPSGDSRLVVQANGVKFTHLNYVLEEARKAGITNLVIESDTLPEGTTNTWF